MNRVTIQPNIQKLQARLNFAETNKWTDLKQYVNVHSIWLPKNPQNTINLLIILVMHHHKTRVISMHLHCISYEYCTDSNSHALTKSVCACMSSHPLHKGRNVFTCIHTKTMWHQFTGRHKSWLKTSANPTIKFVKWQKSVVKIANQPVRGLKIPW